MLRNPLDSWYLHARVSRADTHVYWDADSRVEHRGGKATVEFFLPPTSTDLEVFLDLIRRGVIGTVEQVSGDGDFFHASGWEAIQSQLTDRSKGRDDFSHFWYQLTVHAVGTDRVTFDWAFFGYKYAWRGVALDRDVFYELADRLGARIRLVADWAAIDEATMELSHAVAYSPSLRPRREQIQNVLARLRRPSAETYESAAMDALRQLEGLLRLAVEARGWKGKKDTLPTLIQLVSQRTAISGQDLEILRFCKHVRDYLGHGHEPALHMAKMSVVMAMQALVRFAAVFDELERAELP